jgi:hypothetical protein
LAKATWKDFTCTKKSSCNFEQIENQIVPHFTQNWKDNYTNSRSSHMIIGRSCIKIKPNDIIRFLIGQFDLIMVQLKVLIRCKDIIIL